MKKTNLIGVGEELQDYIADNFRSDPNGALDYSVTGPNKNFTLENFLDIQDLDKIVNSNILLTLYVEDGTMIRSGRQTCQQMSFRFLSKGPTAQVAMDRGRELLQWMEDKRTFGTPHFRFWLAQTAKMPGLVGRSESGTCLADFVVSMYVFSRV